LRILLIKHWKIDHNGPCITGDEVQGINEDLPIDVSEHKNFDLEKLVMVQKLIDEEAHKEV